MSFHSTCRVNAAPIPVAIRDSISSQAGRVWFSTASAPKTSAGPSEARAGGNSRNEEAKSDEGDIFRDLVAVDECTSKVDGIGGIVWEGAILLSQYLRDRLNPSLCGLLIELGCGTGLCGLVAAKMGVRTFLTDREVDLARDNAAMLSRMHPECGVEAVHVCELDWHEPVPETVIAASTKKCKLIVGVEVACLLKQQSALVSVLAKLYSPNSLILITFDAGVEPSQYERSFRAAMRDQGFLSTTAYSGSVEFSELPWGFRRSGMLSLPPTYPEARRTYCTVLADETTANSTPDGVNIDKESCKRHFIEIFYKPSAARTCSRCNGGYFDAFNTSDSCRYHPGYFVCRRHPSETRCSIGGHGDGLGYYGNGKEGWAAKFWDCCGIEDADALGCCFSKHVPY